MPHKGKVPVDEKMRIVASSLSGEIGYTNAALEAGVKQLLDASAGGTARK